MANAGLKGDIEFTKGEWDGVQRVLKAQQASEHANYRDCVTKILPFFKGKVARSEEEPKKKDADKIENHAESTGDQSPAIVGDGVTINQASDKDQQAALQMLENANKRLLSAAAAKEKNGNLSLTQLNYLKAARYYQQAFKLIPSEFAEKQAYYANEAGFAFYKAGKYPQAEPLYQRSLKILEKSLGKNHPNTKTVQKNYNILLATMKE